MSLGHGVNVVRSGLKCLIDISNPKCISATSNQAIDLSGNGFHGILRNSNGVQTALGSMNTSLTYDVSEPNVACLNFLGYGQAAQGYMQFSAHPCGGATQYSVESWFKIVSDTPVMNENAIFYSSLTASEQEFGLMAQASTTDPDLASEIGNVYTAGTSNIRILSGWHHFVLTFNSTTSYVYVDGTLKYSRADTNAALATSGWNWVGVGQWANTNYGDTLHGHTYGKLGTLSLYDKALSVPEIQQNFNATRRRYGV